MKSLSLSEGVLWALDDGGGPWMLCISESEGIWEGDDDAKFVISVKLGHIVGSIVCRM
jgi:hypothetical protein